MSRERANRLAQVNDRVRVDPAHPVYGGKSGIVVQNDLVQRSSQIRLDNGELAWVHTAFLAPKVGINSAVYVPRQPNTQEKL